LAWPDQPQILLSEGYKLADKLHLTFHVTARIYRPHADTETCRMGHTDVPFSLCQLKSKELLTSHLDCRDSLFLVQDEVFWVMTWRHNPEDLDLNLHRRESLKSRTTFWCNKKISSPTAVSERVTCFA
jgi:hypothetical protein